MLSALWVILASAFCNCGERTHSVSQVVFVRKLFDKTALFYVSMDPVLFRNQNYIR